MRHLDPLGLFTEDSLPDLVPNGPDLFHRLLEAPDNGVHTNLGVHRRHAHFSQRALLARELTGANVIHARNAFGRPLHHLNVREHGPHEFRHLHRLDFAHVAHVNHGSRSPGLRIGVPQRILEPLDRRLHDHRRPVRGHVPPRRMLFDRRNQLVPDKREAFGGTVGTWEQNHRHEPTTLHIVVLEAEDLLGRHVQGDEKPSLRVKLMRVQTGHAESLEEQIEVEQDDTLPEFLVGFLVGERHNYLLGALEGGLGFAI